MNWGGPHVGFTCGGFGLVVPRVYPPNGSIVTARYKHPRITPTRGAPSFLNDPEYRSNGILSSIVAVMWEEKGEPGPPGLRIRIGHPAKGWATRQICNLKRCGTARMDANKIAMNVDKCKLCLRENQELQASHLIPAAMYERVCES